MKERTPYYCIMAAAGTSSRMGGTWKLMLPYGDGTIIEASLRAAAACCRTIIVVTGFRAEELESYIEGLSFDHAAVTTVRNDEYPKGMFSSIRRGVAKMRQIEGNNAGTPFFIALADMPAVTTAGYRCLCRESGRAEVIRPLFQGLPAHPVLCSYTVGETIMGEPDDSAMKRVLAQHTLLELPISNKGQVQDVDTPDAYRTAVEQERDTREQ